MKKSSLYIATLMLGAVALGACDDNFEQPPMVVPHATIESNMTIKDFKTMFWKSDRNYVETVGLNDKGEHIVIGGVVSSSDATGNIYKSVIIQDETGALTVAINAYDLYESYQYGQTIYIDVTDLKVGGYNGLMQLGGEGEYNGSPSMTFMDETVASEHIQVDGLGNAERVDTLTVNSITDLSTTTEGLIEWQSRLVRFDNVKFEDAGQAYAPSSTTNRYVTDDAGNRLNVRCSSYSTFKDDIIPSGKGAVVGILSYYGTDWQLLMIDAESAIGFDPVTEPGTSDEPDTPVTPGENDIPEGSGTEASPYSAAQVVAMGAGLATQPDKYVKGYIVGYVPDKALDGAKFEVPATSATNILIASNPDVKDTKQCLPVQLPAGEIRSALNLADNPGNLGKIVTLKGSLEKYFGVAGLKTPTWFSLEGGTSGGGSTDTPTDATQIAAQKFSTDGQGAWSIENVTLPSEMTDIWKQSEKYGMVATAYSNDNNYAADAWLISPVFDLTGVTAPSFTFRHAVNFFSSIDKAKEEATVAVREEGGEWTVLSPAYPTELSWGFVDSGNIDISAFAGKKVQIGFHYTSTATKAGTWEVDSFVLYGKK